MTRKLASVWVELELGHPRPGVRFAQIPEPRPEGGRLQIGADLTKVSGLARGSLLLTQRHQSGHVEDVAKYSSAAPGSEMAEPGLVYSKFETELAVRPDDIDMYQHVHSSRYMDYVLAARFDQMERCYGMPMAEFQKLGYGWVIAATQMNFRRPLLLGDRVTVRCWIEKFTLIGLRLQFEIDRRAEDKRACDGWFDYVMISLESGRPARIPDSIRQKYSI